MSAPSVIRAALKTVIETVAGVGVVFDYERTAIVAGDLQVAFAYTVAGPHTMRGWEIMLRDTLGVKSTSRTNMIYQTWELHALRTVVPHDNTSEVEFDDMLSTVREAINDSANLGGAVESLISDELTGLQTSDRDKALIGDELCHVAVLFLTTQTFEQRTP